MNGHIAINCDGGSRGNPGPSACAFVAANISGKVIFSDYQYLGTTTNNQAEYRGVLLALSWLATALPGNPVSHISIYLDSQLIVNQLNGVYRIKDHSLQQLASQVKSQLNSLSTRHHVQVSFNHIPREQNFAPDALVNRCLDAN